MHLSLTDETCFQEEGNCKAREMGFWETPALRRLLSKGQHVGAVLEVGGILQRQNVRRGCEWSGQWYSCQQ